MLRLYIYSKVCLYIKARAQFVSFKILQTLILPEIRLTMDGYHIGRPDYGFENKKIFVENKKKDIKAVFVNFISYIEVLLQVD